MNTNEKKDRCQAVGYIDSNGKILCNVFGRLVDSCEDCALYIKESPELTINLENFNYTGGKYEAPGETTDGQTGTLIFIPDNK